MVYREKGRPMFKIWQYPQQERIIAREDSLIHINPAAIWLTPTLHIDRQSASSLLKPTFTLSSSTSFFHVLLGLPFFLWTSTPKCNALLKTWPSSLLNTWPYQWTLLAITNRSMASLKPNMNIKSIDLFLSLSCTPHHGSMSIAKFPSHFLSSTTLHFHTVLLALHTRCKQPLSALEEISCHTATHRTPSTKPTNIMFRQSQQPGYPDTGREDTGCTHTLRVRHH